MSAKLIQPFSLSIQSLACSRLRIVVKSRSVKRNAKNARGLGRDTTPFPKSRAAYFRFRFARFNTSALYYLRAWHRLRNFGSQVTGRPSTPQGNQCQISHFLANVGAGNIHVLVNWQLSKQGIYWPISHDRIAGSSVDPSRVHVQLFSSHPLTSMSFQLIAGSTPSGFLCNISG